jgi:hypothetical protein
MKTIEIPLLEADDIEVRIQQACRGNKALALLYKTSRTDMRILDKVFGVYGWKDEYKEIKGNLYCGISIYDEDKKEWITKWDCGIESQQDDGNERKAEASDATKRCAVKLGIGRELYSSPTIFIDTPTKDSGRKSKSGKPIFELENPFERFSVSYITYNDRREIASLEIVDSRKNVVYSYNCGKKPKTRPTSHESSQPNTLSTDDKKAVTGANNRSKTEIIEDLIKDTDLTMETVDKWVMGKFKKTDINYCTADEFEQLRQGIIKFLGGKQ